MAMTGDLTRERERELRERARQWCKSRGLRFHESIPAFAQDEIDSLQKELEQWRKWGVVEIAVRNPQVADYCKHWEERAEKAEAELAGARRLMEKIAEAVARYPTVTGLQDAVKTDHSLIPAAIIDQQQTFADTVERTKRDAAGGTGTNFNSQKGESPMKYDIEAISAKVHEQWMDSKRAKGVTTRRLESGEELMVPYSELSEEAKDLDRGSVKAVIAAIESL